MNGLRDALHSPHTADPHAPVVVRFAALGDVVLLTPLLQALAERHGRPVHLLSSGAWTPQLLAHDSAVGELRLVTSRRAPYWLTPTQWWARRWLESHRGAVYLCDPDPFAARLVARAGIPDGRLLRAWEHRPSHAIHWVDWWLHVAALDPPQHPGPRGSMTTPAQPRLAAPQPWRDECEARLQAQGLAARPLVLVQPGNKKTHRRGRLATAYYDKHWPPGHWGRVIRGVLARLPEAAVLVCGSPREAGLAQALIDAAQPLPAGSRAVNAAATGLPLPRLVALAARAHSMISIDTGPAHVAAAMDCPLVVLFGSAGWGMWKPRAPSSTVTALGCEAPTPGARVEDLSPDDVLAAWAALPPRAAAG